jgi:hypothetical protein
VCWRSRCRRHDKTAEDYQTRREPLSLHAFAATSIKESRCRLGECSKGKLKGKRQGRDGGPEPLRVALGKSRRNATKRPAFHQTCRFILRAARSPQRSLLEIETGEYAPMILLHARLETDA